MRPVRLGLLLAAVPTAALLVAAAPAQAQPSTWNFAQADVTAAAESAGKDGAGVTVAVIDTWVQVAHPDFGGRVLPGADCASGTCVPGEAPQDGCEPHGTHVTGIITSATYGVAPGARILPLRVLAGSTAASCSASTSAVAAALDYAVAQKVRVVNPSLGSDIPGAEQSGLTGAVGRAAAAGVVVVFAAGNSSRPIADSYGTDALVVAATGPTGSLASYSQYGAGVSLAAPGGDVGGSTCVQESCVVSTWDQGRFAALEGTSMAAPAVSATAALLFAQKPSRTRSDVVNLIRATARPMQAAGSGLLDVSAALAPTAAQAASASASPLAGGLPTAPATPAPGVPTAPPSPQVDPTSPAAPLVDPGPALADPASPAGRLPTLAVVAGSVLAGLSGAGWVLTYRRRPS